MTWRPTKIGALLHDDPSKAHAKLTAAFKKHRTREAVAVALDVRPATIGRWVKWLISAGFADPRT